MPAKKFHYKWSWRIFFGSSRRIGIVALGMSQVSIFIFPLPSRGVVGATGFEPVTSRTPSVCATRLRYAPTYNRTRELCNIPWKLRQLSMDSPSGAPPCVSSGNESLGRGQPASKIRKLHVRCPRSTEAGADVPERRIGCEALEASAKLRKSSVDCLSAASFGAARSEQLRLPAE